MHMTPVMFGLITSGPFFMSANPAPTNPQFATGPQKCVVLGPMGEFQISFAFLTKAIAGVQQLLSDALFISQILCVGSMLSINLQTNIS